MAPEANVLKRKQRDCFTALGVVVAVERWPGGGGGPCFLTLPLPALGTPPPPPSTEPRARIHDLNSGEAPAVLEGPPAVPAFALLTPFTGLSKELKGRVEKIRAPVWRKLQCCKSASGEDSREPPRTIQACRAQTLGHPMETRESPSAVWGCSWAAWQSAFSRCDWCVRGPVSLTGSLHLQTAEGDSGRVVGASAYRLFVLAPGKGQNNS